MAYRRTARSAQQVGKSLGFRSGLEKQEQDRLKALLIEFLYEPFVIRYRVEETKKYTPDFVFLKNGIVVETKGYFTTADRKKHKLIKAQFPDLDLRFVFANPNNRIGKKSKTTYALWCETNGFQYASKTIPLEWLSEPVNKKSLALITQFMEEEK